MKKTVYLFGELDFEKTEQLYSDLEQQSIRNGSKRCTAIDIYLCTSGGDQHCMLACYDAIRLATPHVSVIGAGCVLSAGAFVMQAADKRILTKESRFMMHYGSGDVDKDFMDVSKRYEEVLYGKILEKNPDFPIKKFNKMMRDSEHISATEALNLGLVDEVI